MKMPSADEQRADLMTKLQPHVSEPILAVGFLTSAGYVAGLTKDYAVGRAIGMGSPVAGRLFRKKKVEERVSASTNLAVAVTESAVHLFTYPMRGEAFVVAGPPIVWPRADITVTLGKRAKYAQPIHVAFADGHTEDYDIGIGYKDFATFSDAMQALLLASGPAAG